MVPTIHEQGLQSPGSEPERDMQAQRALDATTLPTPEDTTSNDNESRKHVVDGPVTIVTETAQTVSPQSELGQQNSMSATGKGKPTDRATSGDDPKPEHEPVQQDSPQRSSPADSVLDVKAPETENFDQFWFLPDTNDEHGQDEHIALSAVENIEHAIDASLPQLSAAPGSKNSRAPSETLSTSQEPPVKRKRGRPPKSAKQAVPTPSTRRVDEEDQDSEFSLSPSPPKQVVPAKRKRGRPPKSASRPSVSVSHYDDDEDEDVALSPTPPSEEPPLKRKRGRPPKSASQKATASHKAISAPRQIAESTLLTSRKGVAVKTSDATPIMNKKKPKAVKGWVWLEEDDAASPEPEPEAWSEPPAEFLRAAVEPDASGLPPKKVSRELRRLQINANPAIGGKKYTQKFYKTHMAAPAKTSRPTSHQGPRSAIVDEFKAGEQEEQRQGWTAVLPEPDVPEPEPALTMGTSAPYRSEPASAWTPVVSRDATAKYQIVQQRAPGKSVPFEQASSARRSVEHERAGARRHYDASAPTIDPEENAKLIDVFLMAVADATGERDLADALLRSPI